MKIGVIYSPATTMGTEANLAARFYRTKFPDTGGREVQFLFKNPSLDEREIRKAYRELESEEVSVIIGGGVSKVGVVLATEAARSGIPTFGSTTSTQLLSDLKDNFYRPVMGTDRQAVSIIDFLNKLGISRLAIVPHVENTPYTNSFAASLEKYFTGQSSIFPFEPEKGLYGRLQAFAPEAVFVILPPPAIVRLVKEAEFGPNIHVISSEWGYFLPQYSGPLTRNLFIATQNGQVEHRFAELIKEFESVYNQPATFCTDYTFSTLDLVYQAIAAVGRERESLNSYFSNPRIYDYVYGRIYLNEYGDGIHEYYFIYRLDAEGLHPHDRFKMKDFPE